jgi:CheY-like chemotaxis protein
VSHHTVLIVEDEDSVTALEIALATLDGVTVLISSNAGDALELLRRPSSTISAIVTDLRLPQMDGFELIKTIRADDRYSRLPVIVVSGETNPEVAERLRALGANAFFPKPYSPLEVRTTLKGLLHAT